MIDTEKIKALAEKLREDYRNSIKVLPWPYRSAISSTPMEAAAAIDLLLAELEAAAADKRDENRYRELLGLLLAGDIPMSESSVSLNVCGVPPNQDEFDEAVDFLLAQRQGEGS